jgi:L-ascorbate metabolism protein UlaG (beta-lactamase superfamily)
VKVTKYPQSCLLLEKDQKRLVIDPGSFFSARFSVGELGKLEGVLYTHQHADHFDADLAEAFKKQGVMMYGNRAVCDLIKSGCKLAERSSFIVGGFEIAPRDLPHCQLADGSDGPPNTGYIIDGHFFHPGDGVETSGVEVSNLAVPIAGPSISLHTAVKFARSTGAKKVIPIHYDNVDFFPGNPHGFAKVFGEAEVIVLADGESVEL